MLIIHEEYSWYLNWFVYLFCADIFTRMVKIPSQHTSVFSAFNLKLEITLNVLRRYCNVRRSDIEVEVSNRQRSWIFKVVRMHKLIWSFVLYCSKKCCILHNCTPIPSWYHCFSLLSDFWDTAGQERFSSMHPSYYHQAHSCLLVSFFSY